MHKTLFSSEQPIAFKNWVFTGLLKAASSQ
jgi:hypothetical protein